MRYTASQVSSRDPRPLHSLRTTAAGALATALLVPALMLALFAPVAATGVAVLAFTAWSTLRALRRHVRARRTQTRQVCVPKTGVCVDL